MVRLLRRDSGSGSDHGRGDPQCECPSDADHGLLKRAFGDRARALKRELGALLLAWRDPRTPWYARLVALGVVAYAFSPLDLIPDPVPVLGYLDDLILLPLGIWLALRLIPSEVMTEARRRIASGERVDLAHPRLAVAVIISLWIVTLALAIWLARRYV